MREPGWLIRLDDMLECVKLIRQHIRGMTKETFSANRMAIDAVIHNFIILGEAANRIPDDVRDRIPGIAWQKIRGMRNRLVHDYFSVDIDVVWQTACGALPELERVLQQIIATETRRLSGDA